MADWSSSPPGVIIMMDPKVDMNLIEWKIDVRKWWPVSPGTLKEQMEEFKHVVRGTQALGLLTR